MSLLRMMGAEAFEERSEPGYGQLYVPCAYCGDRNLRWMHPRDRTSFFERCAEMLLELSDELERNLYIEAIVKEYGRYGVGTEDIRKTGQHTGI